MRSLLTSTNMLMLLLLLFSHAIMWLVGFDSGLKRAARMIERELIAVYERLAVLMEAQASIAKEREN